MSTGQIKAAYCIIFPVGNPDTFPSDGFSISQGFRAYWESYGIHSGIDISNGRSGDPIHAIADGVVTYSSVNCTQGTGWGTIVRIKHQLSNGTYYYSQYAHMLCNNYVVPQGQNVQMGDLVGYVGNTGMSSGPHLHFEIKNHNTNGSGYYSTDPLNLGFYDPITFILNNRDCSNQECDCFSPPCGCIKYN